MRKSFNSLEIIKDDFFDFTEQCNERECEELKYFITSKKDKLETNQYLLDLLYIKAVTIHEKLETNDAGVSRLIQSFYTDANKFLFVMKESKKVRKSYIKSRADSNKQFRKNAELALVHFSKCLPIEKWPWFTISGTFLGLYRESRFLKHDFDIDLGVYSDEICIEDMIEEIKLCEDFFIGKVYSNLEIINHNNNYTSNKHITHIRLVHTTGINLDIFVHYKLDEICWHGAVLHRWENTIFELMEYTLAGVTVLGPKDADLYLTETYGNWKVPIINYNTILDSPNLAITKNFLSVMLFMKKIAFFLESDIDSANKLIESLVEKSILRINDDSTISLNEYI